MLLKDLGEESGGALVTVLTILTVVSLLTGTVMAVYVVQNRLIWRDVQRVQAEYAAEAAVHYAVARLRRDPAWRTSLHRLQVDDRSHALLTVDSFGGFIRVVGKGKAGGQTSVLRAIVGETPPHHFTNALVVGDRSSGVSIAGATIISGDVLVGEMGVQESLFDGRPFTGRFNGRSHLLAGGLPEYDEGLVVQEHGLAEDLLTGRASAPLSSDSVLVIVTRDDLALDDDEQLDRPAFIISAGNITLSGALIIPPGSRFVAGGEVRLTDSVSGSESIFYGRRAVIVSDSVRCAGQFLSEERVSVGGSAYLVYPSFVYVVRSPSDLWHHNRVEIFGNAIVDGTIIFPSAHPRTEMDRGGVMIAAGATVRGAIYSGARTELHGTVLGTVLTEEFHFYASPTDYINWIKDAAVRVQERPPTFLVPIGFAGSPGLDVVTLSQDASGSRAR